MPDSLGGCSGVVAGGRLRVSLLISSGGASTGTRPNRRSADSSIGFSFCSVMVRGNRRLSSTHPMNPLLRLLGAAASRCLLTGLLTGQIVFSAAFVGACELPNWIHAPSQVNARRSGSTAVSLFFPSGMQIAVASNQPALAPGCWRCWNALWRMTRGPTPHSLLELRAVRSGHQLQPGLLKASRVQAELAAASRLGLPLAARMISRVLARHLPRSWREWSAQFEEPSGKLCLILRETCRLASGILVGSLV